MKKWFGVPHRMANMIVHGGHGILLGLPPYDALGRVVALFDYMGSSPEWSAGGIPSGDEFAFAVGLRGKKAAHFERVFRDLFADEAGLCVPFVNANAAQNNRRVFQAERQRARRARGG